MDRGSVQLRASNLLAVLLNIVFVIGAMSLFVEVHSLGFRLFAVVWLALCVGSLVRLSGPLWRHRA